MTRGPCLPLLLLTLAGGATAQERPPAKSAAKPPAAAPEGWAFEPFAITNEAEDFRLALAGYVQADFRSFRDWQVGDGSDPTLRADDFEWRRLRVGIEGHWRKLRFEFDVDPAFDEGDELKDAWLGVRFARELEVRGGHTKLPMSPEWLTSASRIDFMERALVVEALAPGRDWGGLVEGRLGRVLDYSVGLFEGDARSSSRRAGTTAAARVVLKPAGWLDLGGAFTQGDVEADPVGAGLDPRPKGLEGTSHTGYEFFPGVFVDGRRRRWGAEGRIQAGPVAVWSEFLEAREQRRGQGPTQEDLPDVFGRGWSATFTWLVTGEKKSRAIKPERGLFGGPGAIELSARYEELWFDDVENQGFESSDTRARNVRPAGMRCITGGVSWWPTRIVRLQGNLIVERYDDVLRAPEPGNAGDYVSLFGRVQVSLP